MKKTKVINYTNKILIMVSNEISQSGTWRLKMRACFWIYEELLEHVKIIRTHMSQLSISFCKPASQNSDIGISQIMY